MNSLAKNLCEFIVDEISLINELKKISQVFKEIIIHRNLNDLEQNNHSKKALLLKMVSLQRAKDALISELAISLGLNKDSSVKNILDSKKLDNDAHKILEDHYNRLEEELREIDRINTFVSVMLLSSFKLNKAAIDIFNVHGTVDSTYSRNVKVNTSHRRSKINKKV